MHTMSESRVAPKAPIDTSAPFDPEDWDELRALAHRMMDDLLGHLERIREQPAWRPVPKDVKARLRRTLPRDGVGAEAAYQEFLQDVLPYPVGNTHPRFWGWVIGSGTPFGALADFLAAIVNSNVSGLQGSPRYVEEQVIRWLAELLSYPRDASGLLVSGGSMANLVGLATGLSARAGFDVGTLGLTRAPKQPVLYASTQTHFSVTKAARLLGLGTESLRVIPVDRDYQIDLEVLERRIQEDRAGGLHPFAVVGNAGTVNTGACDDLEALADIAAREHLWFHVDGAFGAFAALVPQLEPMVHGMARADSLAFDLHKWLYVQYDCGCVLVKDSEAHRNTFSVLPSYLRSLDRGLASGPLNFSEYGVQLSRSFKALRAWMGLKSEGVQRYAQQIEQNVRQAQYLTELVTQHPELELLAPTALNIVNFRYIASGLDTEAVNELNAEILMTLQERGIAAPSSTMLHGKFSLRVAICNHRSRREDFDALVEGVVAIAHELTGKVASL